MNVKKPRLWKLGDAENNFKNNASVNIFVHILYICVSISAGYMLKGYDYTEKRLEIDLPLGFSLT